jgi:hypothetical protein
VQTWSDITAVNLCAPGPRRAIEFEDSGVDNCNVADAEGSAKRVITTLPEFFRNLQVAHVTIQVFVPHLQQIRKGT